MDRALIYPGRCTSKPCHSSPNPEGTPAPRLGSKGAGPPEDGIAHPRAKNGHGSGHQGRYSARPVAARRKPRISTPRLTDTSTKRKNCTRELSLNKQTAKRNGASITGSDTKHHAPNPSPKTQPPIHHRPAPQHTPTLPKPAPSRRRRRTLHRCRPVSARHGISPEHGAGGRGHETRRRLQGGERHRPVSPPSWLEHPSQGFLPIRSASPGSPTPDPAAKGYRRPDPAGQSAAWGKGPPSDPAAGEGSAAPAATGDNSRHPSPPSRPRERRVTTCGAACRETAPPCHPRPPPRRPEPSGWEQQILAATVLDDPTDGAGGLLGRRRGGEGGGGRGGSAARVRRRPSRSLKYFMLVE